MFYTLPEKVANYIDQFTGRAWVLPKILQWYENSSERLFLITGDPGTGKSMVAAWLAGSGPLPADPAPGAAPDPFLLFQPWLPGGVQGPPLSPSQQLARIRSLVVAAHFCQAEGTSSRPDEFCRNLVEQLRVNVKAFDDEILAVLDKRIVISPTVTAGTVQSGGTVTGAKVGTINLESVTDDTRFNLSVCAPLISLYKRAHPGPVLIIVDSMDEALSYAGPTKIPDLLTTLKDLPPDVRFLITSRPDPRVLRPFFEVRRLDLIGDAPADASPGGGDVRQFVGVRLAGKVDEPQRSDLAEEISKASGGIFLYARLVVDDLLKDLQTGELKPDLTFPPGLSAYYYQWLYRQVGKDDAAWRALYKPVLGVVAVGQGEGLKTDQVQNVTRADAEKVLGDALQFLDGAYPTGPYRLFHKSFADFLVEGKENPDRKVDGPGAHAMIADYYYSLGEGGQAQAGVAVPGEQAEPAPLGEWDDYAQLYIPVHLAGAAGLADKQARHQQAARLVRLVQDPVFLDWFRSAGNDEFQVKHTIISAVHAAAADTTAAGPELLLTAVRLSQAHRHEWLRPPTLFELAERGDLDAAVRQLSAFPIELQWQRAASLVLAWSAAKANPAKARQTLDRVEQMPDRTNLEGQLGWRVRQALDGVAAPAGPLAAPPDRDLIDRLFRRLGGQSVEGKLDPAFISGWEYGPGPQGVDVLGEYSSEGKADDRPILLAEQDGPNLVAFAGPEPNRQEGLAIFQRYLAIQGQNPYIYYRNASLWLLIQPVLAHPSNEWAQAALKSLFLTALDVEGVAFEEGLELALLALQARGGDAAARQTLDERRLDTLQVAATLTPARDEGDVWGAYRRRLCALALAYSVLPDGQPLAEELLKRAAGLPGGFAGFMTRARENLAETARACGLEGAVSTADLLHEALQSAENIQDSVFCARSTARANAMIQRWWPLPGAPKLEDVVRKFSREPDAVEFTAIHLMVTEATPEKRFPLRDQGPNKLPLSESLLRGKTLRALADAFRLPLADFVAANEAQGWGPDTPLPDKAWVNVPDPEFAPLIAARLAAEVLQSRLLPERKRELIQLLVPPAIHDRTSLDTILSCLMLAAQPGDAQLLARLLPLARQVYAQFPDVSGPTGHIQTYAQQNGKNIWG